MDMTLVPYVIEQTSRGERSYDIFSRLLNDRIIMLNDEVNSASAGVIIAQMLFLEGQDPDKDISFYINSPGGSVTDGMAASMGACRLAAGTKGKRFALPNSEIMIHQPLGQAKGQATDILIHAHHIEKIRANINRILADATGKPLEQIQLDTERDNFMTAAEAAEYGLIDKVISKR